MSWEEDVLDVWKEIVSSNPTCLWSEIMDSNPTSLWRNWGQERALQVWTVFYWNWVRRVNPTWECQSFFCHLLRVNSLLCRLSFVMFVFIHIFVSDWLMLQDRRFLLLFLNTLPRWEHMYLITCQFWLCGVLLGEGKCYEGKGRNRGMLLQEEGGRIQVAERCWCKKSGGRQWQWDWVSLLLPFPTLKALSKYLQGWRWEGPVCEHREAINWLLKVKNWANVKENWILWNLFFRNTGSQGHMLCIPVLLPLFLS